jgi:uncharacterized protein YecE (DUF72 family)
MTLSAAPNGLLYLGCPVWACDHWRGALYRSTAARATWLGQYSSVFQTVEGNSTFYALPNLDTARRWAESVQAGFRFSLKVSRSISHDRRLRDADRELDAFLAVARVLHEHDVLGPSFLQLSPDFAPTEQSALESFLVKLPRELPWAVEVRHPDWYDQSTHESWLDGLLAELGMDKVLFDSRPLYSKPPSDDVERESQRRKPKTPIRETVTAKHPFLRIVGRNRIDEAMPWIELWAPIIAQWLRAGLSPYIFTHAPDDRFAPQFARVMHAAIQRHIPELPAMAPWPGEVEESSKPKQLDLF